MDASFYPPRDHFNNNSYDDNLKLQHEALKRIMNKYDICSTNEELSTTMIDKIQAKNCINQRQIRTQHSCTRPLCKDIMV